MTPYQFVGISLSATTSGGEGPQSDYFFNRTEQSDITNADVNEGLNASIGGTISTIIILVLVFIVAIVIWCSIKKIQSKK